MEGRKLLVVLQEEDPKYVKQIHKDLPKLEKYRYYIASSNNLLRRLIPVLWTATNEVEYKTYSACKTLSASSKDYITLEFSSLRMNDNIELYKLDIDSSEKKYEKAHELFLLNEYGFFEVSLIEKFGITSTYTFYTTSSLPNELDFITALVQTSVLLGRKIDNPKGTTADYEAVIRFNNKLLLEKTLLADSLIVERYSKKFDYVKEEYLSAYEMSSAAEIVNKSIQKDSSVAYFIIVPFKDAISRGNSYEGMTGGGMTEYEKKFYLMQLIVDAAEGKILYYDKVDETKIFKKDWKRFLRFTEERNLFTPIKKGKNDSNNNNNRINNSQVPQY